MTSMTKKTQYVLQVLAVVMEQSMQDAYEAVNDDKGIAPFLAWSESQNDLMFSYWRTSYTISR